MALSWKVHKTATRRLRCALRNDGGYLSISRSFRRRPSPPGGSRWSEDGQHQSAALQSGTHGRCSHSSKRDSNLKNLPCKLLLSPLTSLNYTKMIKYVLGWPVQE